MGRQLYRATVVATLLSAWWLAQAQHIDRIVLNGKIWTEDDERPLAQAFAVSGDRIVALGTDEQIRRLASPDTAVLDLRGRLVVPGFQDSHLHFPGRSVNELDLHGFVLRGRYREFLTA